MARKSWSAVTLVTSFTKEFKSLAASRRCRRIARLNWTYPFWLKMDNRTIADEFFRGSYTFGIWADGEIDEGLEYRVMIANNLSALGISPINWMPILRPFRHAVVDADDRGIWSGRGVRRLRVSRGIGNALRRALTRAAARIANRNPTSTTSRTAKSACRTAR